LRVTCPAHLSLLNLQLFIMTCTYTYINIHVYMYIYIGLYRGGTWWRSWLRHYATSRKVVGSIFDDVIGIFH
jgi:hypothetical protein